ncbi:MAG: metallophosphoesterase [Candidatus Melainabacteria bacterium]|nr:metallophosphoesterase [Candidatus Melainabacteria bacterium]
MKRIALVLSIVLTFALVVFAQDSKSKKEEVLLHFVHVSDTHLQRSIARDSHRLHKSSELLLEKTVSQINNLKDIDFILHTGDIVDQPTSELVDKFIEVTMSLKYPMHVLFGNHDVGVNAEVSKKEFIKKFNSLEGATSFTNGMTYYSFSPKGDFTFICLDGATDKEVTSNGQINNEQLKWLEKELEKNKDKFVIIALHYPLVEPFKSESHKFIEPDGTKLLNLPAIIQYPVAFREVIIKKDAEGENLLVDFKWHPIDAPELIEISKQHSGKSWKLTEGTNEDKRQTIKLRIY